jgi:hypothetical protein
MLFILGIIIFIVGFVAWLCGVIGTIKTKYNNDILYKLMWAGLIILNVGNLMVQIVVFTKLS